jgi:hypothetical protein
MDVAPRTQNLEAAGGFRPDRFQLIKFSYELTHYGTGTVQNNNTFAIQFVTTLQRSFGRE